MTALAEKLKRRSKDDFKGRHFEPGVIIQAVTWYLRYSLSRWDVESLFAERGFDVERSTAGCSPIRPRSRSGCGNSGVRIAARSASTKPV